MKNYICKYLDASGQEKSISFAGNIVFSFNQLVDSENEINETENAIRFEEYYDDYEQVINNGLSALNNSIDLSGSNYCFYTVVNEKEFLFFIKQSLHIKRYSLGINTDTDEAVISNYEDCAFRISLELI